MLALLQALGLVLACVAFAVVLGFVIEAAEDAKSGRGPDGHSGIAPRRRP